jgi:hypothetical protein
MAEIVALGQSEALKRWRRRRNALSAIEPDWPDDWPDCIHQTWRNSVRLTVVFARTPADPAVLPALVRTFDAAGYSLTHCDLTTSITLHLEADIAPYYTIEIRHRGSGVIEEEARVMFEFALEETGAPAGKVYTIAI